MSNILTVPELEELTARDEGIGVRERRLAGPVESAPLAYRVAPDVLRLPERTATVTWARDHILFSSCNEDSRSELQAFGSLARKRVFCVTAGGGRVLSLLLARPAEIWAVDLNPAQNYLLELKIAGMRALDHGAYLRFLGVRPCRDRLATYQQLRPHLSAAAQLFFERQPALLDNGILLQGRLERYLRRAAVVLRLVQPLGTRRLFGCSELEEQRRLLDRVDHPLFRFVAETLGRRTVLRLFSGDPGFYRHVPRDVPLHREIVDGFMTHFRHHLARDNPLFQLVFFGRWTHESALPPYLNAATYEQAQAALRDTRLVMVTNTVAGALAGTGPDAVDAFSLSDISSYLDDAEHAELFDAVLRVARPGAKLCSRSNIVHRPLTPAQASRIERDRALEARLAVSDHSCVHKFLIGTVR